jgi:glycine cleavage system transcriptional repressor
MLMIRMPEGMVSRQLQSRLEPLGGDLGLQVHLHDVRPEEAVETLPQRQHHLIHVYGADRKGIVYSLTRHLAGQSVNITNLHTEVIHHASPLYVMMIEVELPPFVDAGRLQSELSAIGKDIGVVVSMKPKDDARF